MSGHPLCNRRYREHSPSGRENHRSDHYRAVRSNIDLERRYDEHEHPCPPHDTTDHGQQAHRSLNRLGDLVGFLKRATPRTCRFFGLRVVGLRIQLNKNSPSESTQQLLASTQVE